MERGEVYIRLSYSMDRVGAVMHVPVGQNRPPSKSLFLVFICLISRRLSLAVLHWYHNIITRHNTGIVSNYFADIGKWQRAHKRTSTFLYWYGRLVVHQPLVVYLRVSELVSECVSLCAPRHVVILFGA